MNNSIDFFVVNRVGETPPSSWFLMEINRHFARHAGFATSSIHLISPKSPTFINYAFAQAH